MAKKDKKDKLQDSTNPESRFWRYCFICLLTGLVVFLWLSMVTYNKYDPPSQLQFPQPDPVHNSAGKVGAYLAYMLWYWLGCGSYMGLVFTSIASVILIIGGRIQYWHWRFFGVLILMTATSTAAFLINPFDNADLAAGTAGILGKSAGDSLLNIFRPAGAWLVVAVCLGIGLMLAADNLMLKLPGLFRKIWHHTSSQIPAAISAISVLKPSSNSPVTAESNTVTSSPRAIAAVPASSRLAAATKAAEPAKSQKPVKPGKGILPDFKALRDRAMAVPPPPAAVTPTPAVASPLIVPPPSISAGSDVEDDASITNPRIAASPAAQTQARPVAAQPQAQPVAGIASIAQQPQQAQPQNPERSATAPAAATKLFDIPSEKSAQPSKPAESKEDQKFVLPSASLLTEPTGGYLATQETQAEQKRAILQQTLNDFNVQAEVVGYMTGPVITLFELSLSPGVKVAQVANLATDIARALAVPGVRIVSPIPGKDTVGIEVPNLQKEIVRIKELMNSKPEAQKNMHLPLYLGKDAGGGTIVTDLSKMPHMLIAGTTGSGKSVCINTIIMSLLLTRTPEDVRLILVDPKMVEMAAFENLPHLLCPVVNDMRRAEEILEWAATKMDERYELLKEAGVKNIASFNSLSKDELYKRFHVESEEERQRIPTRLPYYVIIIDELADLIMTSSKEVELHITRIAAKARAVGIHLILATQRPSVNVVTGLIKSNMPCRISFKVASRQESRIVLDQNGAEVLMGQGDMLFLQPGTSNLARALGTYVDDGEIRMIVDALKATGQPQYNPELLRLGSPQVGEDGGGERDELFDKAVEIVLQSQRGSVSLLQRRLQIGYSRSSRIIDQMADAGILGDYKGSQARECLMTLDDWYALKSSISRDQSGEASLDGEPTSA